MPYVYLDIDSVFFEESRKIYSFFLLKGGGGGIRERFFCGFLILLPSSLPLASEMPFIGMDV